MPQRPGSTGADDIATEGTAIPYRTIGVAAVAIVAVAFVFPCAHMYNAHTVFQQSKPGDRYFAKTNGAQAYAAPPGDRRYFVKTNENQAHAGFAWGSIQMAPDQTISGGNHIHGRTSRLSHSFTDCGVIHAQ